MKYEAAKKQCSNMSDLQIIKWKARCKTVYYYL